MVVTLQKDLKRSLRDLLNWEEGEGVFHKCGQRQPPLRVDASSSLQQGSAFPPGFLTAPHYAFPFHLGDCLKERGKEGKDPRILLLITSLCTAIA